MGKKPLNAQPAARDLQNLDKIIGRREEVEVRHPSPKIRVIHRGDTGWEMKYFAPDSYCPICTSTSYIHLPSGMRMQGCSCSASRVFESMEIHAMCKMCGAKIVRPRVSSGPVPMLWTCLCPYKQMVKTEEELEKFVTLMHRVVEKVNDFELGIEVREAVKALKETLGYHNETIDHLD